MTFPTKMFLPSVNNGTTGKNSSRSNRKKVAAAVVVVETKNIDSKANKNTANDKANEKVVSTTTTTGSSGGGSNMRKLFEKAAPTITTTKENKPKPAAAPAEVAVTAAAAAMKNQDAKVSSSGLLPDRWLDYFCIVGLDPNNVKLLLEHNGHGQEKEEEGSTPATSAAAPATAAITDNNNKKDKKHQNANSNIVPVLLDRYPKENHIDMEFPIHLPSFCFPKSGGVQPIQYKTTNTNSLNQPVSSPSSSKKKKRKKKMKKKKESSSNNNKVSNVKYHHHRNVPEPSLCSMVLTSGSGHRLYCTTLTVYEKMRVQQEPPPQPQDIMKIKLKREKEKIEKMKEKMETALSTVATVPAMPPITTTTRTNWWEEESTSMKVKEEGDNTKEVTINGDENDNDENVVDIEEEVYYYWMVPKCLVVLSHYPFFQAQSTILKEVFYTVQSGVSPLPLERYIAHIMKDIPLPTIHATIHDGNGSSSKINNDDNYSIVEWTSWLAATTPTTKLEPTLRLEQPPPNKLPLLDVSMEPLFRTLSLSNILVIWATLLQEGKVVLACNSVETASLLTPISEAILSLLFPLQWQGIYIPVLPNNESVFDILDAPVPYLIGVITNNKPNSNSNSNQMGSQNHPAGVVWVDIDTDTIHLGFKENDPNQMYFLRQQQQEGNNNNNGYTSKPEELPVLPALPQDSSMKLMVELEEIVDPFYLPTVTGIKGNITIGDRSVELNNSCRPPYAQRTKLFDNAVDYYTPTPRKYILSQAGKVPPRSSGSGNGNGSGSVQWNDYNFIPSHMKTKKKKNKKNKNKENCDNDDDEYDQDNDIVLCGISLDELMQQFPCAEDTTTVDEDDTVVTAEPTTTAAAGAASKELQVSMISRRDSATKSFRDSNTSQDSNFVVQLKRQGRSMQAHADRFMAVFGVDYATPSQYAARTTLQLLGGEDDVLNRQDKIAANFYLVDHSSNTSERVRQRFLNFFVTTLARYKFFVDDETQRIDEERFIKSLNLGQSQREYVRMIITSQMFEIFLSQQDISSIRRRRLFDEHIIKHSGGAIKVSGGTFGGNNKTTIKNKSNTKSTSKISTTTTTPLLDSIQWREPTIIVPQQPCVVGLKKGRLHCHDRRFPDHLVKEECITNDTVSSWKLFWDGSLCSAFLSCT